MRASLFFVAALAALAAVSAEDFSPGGLSSGWCIMATVQKNTAGAAGNTWDLTAIADTQTCVDLSACTMLTTTELTDAASTTTTAAERTAYAAFNADTTFYTTAPNYSRSGTFTETTPMHKMYYSCASGTHVLIQFLGPVNKCYDNILVDSKYKLTNNDATLQGYVYSDTDGSCDNTETPLTGSTYTLNTCVESTALSTYTAYVCNDAGRMLSGLLVMVAMAFVSSYLLA